MNLVDISFFSYIIVVTALQAGRSRFRYPMESLGFFTELILPAALWPCVRLSLWHKRVLGLSAGGKGAHCVGLTTLPTSCADCLEILGSSTSWNPKGRPGLYGDSFTFIHCCLRFQGSEFTGGGVDPTSQFREAIFFVTGDKTYRD